MLPLPQVGGEACVLPALYNGIPVYDCITYDANATAAVQPWCFTNVTTGETRFKPLPKVAPADHSPRGNNQPRYSASASTHVHRRLHGSL